MAVVMRLRRMGSNQRPFYRLVVTDSRNPREGRFLERLGDYDPKREKECIRLLPDRIQYWLGQGAVPSERVGQLLKTQGIACSKKEEGRKKEGSTPSKNKKAKE